MELKLKSFQNLFTVLLFSIVFTTASGDNHTHDDGSVHNEDHSVVSASNDEEFHSEVEKKEHEFNAGEMIMHHIADANEIHLFGHTSIPLPVIIYNTTHGNFFFGMSNQFDHGHKEVGAYKYDHGRIVTTDGSSYIDFSITKNVFVMLLGGLLLLVIFIPVARKYNRNKGNAPTGLQNVMETFFVFIRDEVAKPYLGDKYEKYLNLLLTFFFFILMLNLLGLVPMLAANVTGNIAVTLGLALITFIVVNINGSKDYWMHILWPPGVPVFVKLILIPVELLGIITKPFALMVRLFANITAGHIIILSFVSLIFLFGDAGRNAIGAGVGAFVAFLFSMFMNVLELLVAFIQAFIFTTLTAVFIGQATEEHAH